MTQPTTLGRGGPFSDVIAITLRAMSFNLRYGAANDGENDWLHRRDLVVQTVRTFAPDLLATQEALALQVEFLRKQLCEYDVVAAGREDGLQRGEATAVFYRADRFELCAEEHFWLSETPHVPGSTSWGGSQTRMVTGCRLRLRKCTGRQLWFFNTHFDHRSQAARIESARLLRLRIEQVAAHAPVILAGDFNATEHDSEYSILLHGDGSRPSLIDAYRSLHPQHNGRERTRHGFRGETCGSRIDWILHSPQLKPAQAAIVRSATEGRFPSDHYPVTAVVEWPT